VGTLLLAGGQQGVTAGLHNSVATLLLVRAQRGHIAAPARYALTVMSG
jgi:hypothetical protein